MTTETTAPRRGKRRREWERNLGMFELLDLDFYRKPVLRTKAYAVYTHTYSRGQTDVRFTFETPAGPQVWGEVELHAITPRLAWRHYGYARTEMEDAIHPRRDGSCVWLSAVVRRARHPAELTLMSAVQHWLAWFQRRNPSKTAMYLFPAGFGSRSEKTRRRLRAMYAEHLGAIVPAKCHMVMAIPLAGGAGPAA